MHCFPQLFLLVCLLFTTVAGARGGEPLPLHLAEELAELEALAFDRGRLDEIMLRLNAMVAERDGEKTLHFATAIPIHLLRARILVKTRRYVPAIRLLGRIRSAALRYEQRGSLAQAYLVLARLFANSEQPAEVKYYLERARSLIKLEEEGHMQSRLAYQLGDWHRGYGFTDSVRHYAQLMLDAFPGEPTPEARAKSLYLTASIRYHQDYRSTNELYQEVLRLIRPQHDYLINARVWNDLATLYIDNGIYSKGRMANDSAIANCLRVVTDAYKVPPELMRAYHRKGNLFASEGRMDSAYFYVGLVNTQRRINAQENQRIKALEIDARFRDEQKAIQLMAQGQALERQRRIQLMLVGLVFLTGLFLAVLVFLTLRLRHSKQKIETQASRLRRLNRAKTRFFTNVSHELRTPLALVLGPIQSLRRQAGNWSDQQVELLNVAARGGENLKHLVDEILDLAKIDAGKTQIQLTPVAPARFFRQYLVQFESLAENKGIDYVFRHPSDDGPVIFLDREKCRQILFNLLSNAFKFTPNGGRITADITYHDGLLHMRVADSGPGIHPDDVSQIFDRYYQTDRPETAAAGGTGIGLALCREYVNLFGGTLTVESDWGRGAEFLVAFPAGIAEKSPESVVERALAPLSPLSPTVRSIRPPESATTPSEKPGLLIVDDNADLRRYLSLILEEKYRVQTAGDGAQAWALLDTATPSTSDRPAVDLMISDLMMPVMDGYQLLEKTKADPRFQDLPVVMLTSRAEREDRLKALRIGVDDYVQKPFDEEELLLKIDRLLTNQRVRRFVSGEEVPEEDAPELSLPDQKWLTTLEAFVRDRLSDTGLSVSFIAQEFAMSESTLLRQVKRLTGLTPRQYIKEVRLDEARRLLETRRYESVNRVGTEVGYPDSRSFSRVFKQHFGKLPSEL